MQKHPCHITTREIGAHLLDENLDVGIDKMKLVFRIKKLLLQPDNWKTYYHSASGSFRKARISCPSYRFGEVSLGAIQNYGGLFGWAEFNPSKIMNEDCKLATSKQARESIQYVFEAVENCLELESKPWRSMIYRLDLTVDFDPVSDMLGLFQLAQRCQPYRQQKACTYFDPRKIETESVMFRTRGKGSTVFYNKSKEQKKKGSHFRIEVQASRKELTANRINDFQLFSPSSLRRVFMARISNFANLCCSHPESHLDQILTSKNDTNHLIDIAGHEYLNSKGVKVPKTDHYMKKDRQFKKEFNYQSLKDLI